MASEPLVDLTQPVPQTRRQSQPKAPAKNNVKVKVVRSRAGGTAGQTTEEAAKEAKVLTYRAWIEQTGSPLYLKAANFVTGTDLKVLFGPPGPLLADGLPNPHPIAERFEWTGTRSYMAATAAVELETTAPIKWAKDFIGPIAPWLLLGGCVVAVGMDAFLLLQIRRTLQLKHAPGSPEQVAPQPPTQPATPEESRPPTQPVQPEPAPVSTTGGNGMTPEEVGALFRGEV
jgi:hypothetical protein